MNVMILNTYRKIIRLVPLFAFLASMVSAQSVESVVSQKERCMRKLEDIERNLENSAVGIERIKRLRPESGGVSTATDAFVEKTQSTIEYMRNRIERSRNQVEKIDSDLQNAQTSKQCPKCIASDVNLFCRHVESLFSDNTDLMSSMNEFERSLRAQASLTDLINRNDRLIAGIAVSSRNGNSRYRAATLLQEKAKAAAASGNADAAVSFALEAGDSAAALQGSTSAECSLTAEIEHVSSKIEEAMRAVARSAARAKASAVLEKARLHWEKGKVLCSEGKTDAAGTELAIAGKFASAAAECAVRKE